MKNILLGSAVFLLLLSCGSVKKYNEEVLALHTAADLHKDIDKTYIRLKRSHPKLYQYISKERLDFKFDSLKKSIVTPLTSEAFYYKIAPVVKTIGQGHISVSAPHIKKTKTERKSYKNKSFGFLKMDFKYVEDRLFVARAEGADTILVGSEILEVDTKIPKELIAAYNKNFSSDGYNKTLYKTFVGSRFGGFYKKDKGFLDSLNIKFKNKDSVFLKQFVWENKVKKGDSLLNIKKDSIAKAKFLDLTKEQKKTRKDSIKKSKKETNKEKKTRGYQYRKDVYNRSLDFVGQDSTVAYMKIRGFSMGDFKTFYEDSFKTMDRLATKSLIIDLRDNGGGRVKEINDLYGYLTAVPYVMYTESEVKGRTPVLKSMMSNTSSSLAKVITVLLSPGILVHNLLKTKRRDGTSYYKLKGVKPLKPKETSFKGKLYVLINGNSFSASSVLSTNLKRDKRAIFVGEETGGAHNGTVAGMMRGYRMPTSKVVIRFGLLQVESPYKVETDGYGVMPDIELTTTAKQFENGVDAEMEWVLSDIETKK